MSPRRKGNRQGDGGLSARDIGLSENQTTNEYVLSIFRFQNRANPENMVNKFNPPCFSSLL